MTTLTAQLTRLFFDNISIDQQVAIINELNHLQWNGEALAEIATFLLSFADLLPPTDQDPIDIVGTGGDGANTLNFSTLAAFVVRACGYTVAKHGNRSFTSQCGSFDLLRHLDVTIPETPTMAAKILEQQGLVFLFAPYYHPILAKVANARLHFAKLKQRTIFNVLGPLLNPARVKKMLVGVYAPQLLAPYADALQRLGVEVAYVVHGAGLDEATLTGTTDYICLQDGKLRSGQWTPSQLGFPSCALADLTGGDAEHNYQESLSMFNGKTVGPKRNMVIINAALATHIASRFQQPLTACIAAATQALALVQIPTPLWKGTK